MSLSEIVLGTTTVENVNKAIERQTEYGFNRSRFVDVCTDSQQFQELVLRLLGTANSDLGVTGALISALCVGMEIGTALFEGRTPTRH
jgi:hypothetical protein